MSRRFQLVVHEEKGIKTHAQIFLKIKSVFLALMGQTTFVGKGKANSYYQVVKFGHVKQISIGEKLGLPV